MKIFEILDISNPKSRYNYQIVKTGPRDILARFVTDQNDTVNILVYKTNNIWNIAFSRDDNYSVTGEGDQYKIFNTVFFFLYQLLKTNQPKYLIFSANNQEPSRIKLYKTFIRRIIPKYFSGFITVPETGFKRLLIPKGLKSSDYPEATTFILKNTRYTSDKQNS
jgi:hypothetical protein